MAVDTAIMNVPAGNIRNAASHLPLDRPLPLSAHNWPEGTVPALSICCITYNHGKHIQQAIDGFLMQETDFPVEIIIRDDASTDGTADAIRHWAERYPRLFKPVLYAENQYAVCRKPIVDAFQHARGAFVAVCEGDDHWIDPHKLQRQVEALEADPGASGCFSNAYNEGGGQRVPFLGKYTTVPHGPVLDEEAYLRGQGIPTCTFVFRRALLDVPRFKGIAQPFATGDTALFTYLLGKGHFIHQPFFTGVRVMHEGGVYAMRSRAHKLRVWLTNIPLQDALSGGRHSAVLRERRRTVLRSTWTAALREEDWELAREVWPLLARERDILGWSLGEAVQRGLMVRVPGVYKAVQEAWKGFVRPINRLTRRTMKKFKPRTGG